MPGVTSRRPPVRLLVAAGLLLLLALPASAMARPGDGRPHGVLHITLDGGRAEVTRAHGSVFVKLKDVDGMRVSTFKGRKTTGTKSITVGALRRGWDGRLGPRPVVELYGGGARTTLVNLTGKPVWNKAERSLTFSADATQANRMAAGRVDRLGTDIRARILPTRAPVPGRRLAPMTRQTATAACTTIQPARANTSFCLPWQSGLGTGNTSFVNVLSGTMQTAPSCQVTPILSEVGGNATVVGEIDVYQDAASAQAALSASMQAKYSQGLVSAEAKASFSSSTSTSTNAVYAIAQVNLISGTVNLGKPQLSSSSLDDASAIAEFSDALQFLSDCGDSVPVSYNVGASWMAVLQMNTASESSASSLYTSIKGSYAGVSAGSSFSKSVESSSFTESIVESDYCAGPPSCTSVPGYQDPASAGSDVDTAMNIFTNNYSLMLTNLANLCDPGPTLANCITQMQYQPIYTLLPGGSTTSPSAMVSDAATSVYSINANFNGWATGYQALMTGYPSSYSYWDWDMALDDLTDTAPLCDINGLTSSTCANQFQWCWNEISYSLSSQSPDCLPSAFYVNDLYGLTNPAQIDPDVG
jgi:hypothetical protein